MIEILDNHTIDQIAAGEVVERPSSVVKELIENSMDAGATMITVEIKNGGIEYIRVTDNGYGILKEDMEKAFLRHATSKLHDIDELSVLTSMGFRGEALASISAVSKMECISKTEDSLLGYRYYIAGGKGEEMEEVGAPTGTTMVVRNLFYNTPARRKFLKSESTEGGYIEDMLQHLAMARPDISFQFINNGKVKLATTGSNDLGDLVYRIFGRETASECFSLKREKDGIIFEGVLGTPSMNRSTRNYENYFVNHRYVKSDILSKAVENGYVGYVMQHKYPFCVLHIDIAPTEVDVNVHPAKTEIRLHNAERIFNIVSDIVRESLTEREMIHSCKMEPDKREKEEIKPVPMPFERHRIYQNTPEIQHREENLIASSPADASPNPQNSKEIKQDQDIFTVDFSDEKETVVIDHKSSKEVLKNEGISEIKQEKTISQLSFFPTENKVLSKEASEKFEIIGQIFNTYWIISYNDSVYFIDQHAAHEKVNYERLMNKYKENRIESQTLNPPLVFTLTAGERNIITEKESYFRNLGFEIEEFGGNEIALRSVPLEVYFSNEKNMFLEILAELVECPSKKDPLAITMQIATMACKASVKGGRKMSLPEVKALINELLLCENPYHCPHGRPTIFSMSRYELEKKFKRIVE